MKKVIIILAAITLTMNSFGQTNTNAMIEKIDFDYLEKYAKKERYREKIFSPKITFYQLRQTLDDGTEIHITGFSNTGFYEVRVPPLPVYWMEVYRYYPSGIIQEKGKEFGSVKIGIWRHYDQNGQLIKEENCDEKFGAFGHEKVVCLLAEKELIGENGERLNRMQFDYKENEHKWVILNFVYEIGGPQSVVYADEYIIDSRSGKIVSEAKRKAIKIPEVPRPKMNEKKIR